MINTREVNFKEKTRRKNLQKSIKAQEVNQLALAQ